jgi:hypothetical protein
MHKIDQLSITYLEALHLHHIDGGECLAWRSGRFSPSNRMSGNFKLKNPKTGFEPLIARFFFIHRVTVLPASVTQNVARG